MSNITKIIKMKMLILMYFIDFTSKNTTLARHAIETWIVSLEIKAEL